jgi:hypothetical protein
MVVTRVSRLLVEYPCSRNARRGLTTLMIDCIYWLTALGMAGTCNVLIVVEFHPRLLILILIQIDIIFTLTSVPAHSSELFRPQ